MKNALKWCLAALVTITTPFWILPVVLIALIASAVVDNKKKIDEVFGGNK